MFQKLLHFIKYNNAAIVILVLVLVLGSGALAAGPDAIGQKQTSVEGMDNTALLATDLTTFSMDFKVENIEQDDKYYYVTYSYMDLTVIDNAWQYQLSSKTQKVSKKIKEDVGVYMAKFMAKHYEARIRELTQEKERAESQGEQKRVEVTEYSGLIGKTLDIAATVFPGYEPVVKQELPSPELPTGLPEGGRDTSGGVDNLTKIYNDYIAAHPEIFTTPAPTTNTPDSIEATDTPTETPTVTEPESVNVIDLPVSAPESPAETAPAADATPTSEAAPTTEAAPTPVETPAPEVVPAQ